METRYLDIQDFANRNLSWKIVSFSKNINDVEIGVVQNANNQRFRVVRLQSGIVLDDVQINNYERAANIFESLVKEETNASV